MQSHMASFRKDDSGQFIRTDFDPECGCVYCGVEKVFDMARGKWVWRIWAQQDKPYHRIVSPQNEEPSEAFVKERQALLVGQILERAIGSPPGPVSRAAST